MDNLPIEVVYNIMEFMEVPAIINLIHTCHRFYNIREDTYFLKRLKQILYGDAAVDHAFREAYQYKCLRYGGETDSSKLHYYSDSRYSRAMRGVLKYDPNDLGDDQTTNEIFQALVVYQRIGKYLERNFDVLYSTHYTTEDLTPTSAAKSSDEKPGLQSILDRVEESNKKHMERVGVGGKTQNEDELEEMKELMQEIAQTEYKDNVDAIASSYPKEKLAELINYITVLGRFARNILDPALSRRLIVRLEEIVATETAEFKTYLKHVLQMCRISANDIQTSLVENKHWDWKSLHWLIGKYPSKITTLVDHHRFRWGDAWFESTWFQKLVKTDFQYVLRKAPPLTVGQQEELLARFGTQQLSWCRDVLKTIFNHNLKYDVIFNFVLETLRNQLRVSVWDSNNLFRLLYQVFREYLPKIVNQSANRQYVADLFAIEKWGKSLPVWMLQTEYVRDMLVLKECRELEAFYDAKLLINLARKVGEGRTDLDFVEYFMNPDNFHILYRPNAENPFAHPVGAHSLGQLDAAFFSGFGGAGAGGGGPVAANSFGGFGGMFGSF